MNTKPYHINNLKHKKNKRVCSDKISRLRFPLPPALILPVLTAIILLSLLAGCGAQDISPADTGDDSGNYNIKTINVYNDDGQKIYGQVYIPNGASPSHKVPLVIFSHGLGSTHKANIAYAKRLADAGYAAYIFDFRGGSSKPNNSDGSSLEMSVMTEADDIETVIDSARNWDFANTDELVLAGRSQGGFATALVAARRPEAAKAVILLYPALSIVDYVHDMFYSENSVPDSFSMMNLVTVGRNYATDVWDLDVYGTIRKYEGPVLILHGNKDKVIDISYSERAAKAYNDVEYHVIKGSGHGFEGDNFDLAVNYMLNFLQRQLEK